MSKESIGGVVFESPQEEQLVSNIDISKISKDFLLSRIDVSSNETSNDDTYTESDIAKIKNELGAIEIPPDEEEKFGLRDDQYHKEHLSQTA